MRKNVQITLLDKIIMFYEAIFFIFFVIYQMVSRIQAAEILIYLHMALIISVLFTLTLIIRAIILKNPMWERGKPVLLMLVILNIMIIVFSF